MLGAAGAATVLMAFGALVPSFMLLLVLWFLVGAAYSAALTPSGRLLRRSAHPEDRPAVFAAQFALSHACWLLTYPLVGWLGANAGFAVAFVVMAALGVIGVGAALWLWPRLDPEVMLHTHDDLDPNHPHIANTERTPTGYRHAHAYVIDAIHAAWPTR